MQVAVQLSSRQADNDLPRQRKAEELVRALTVPVRVPSEAETAVCAIVGPTAAGKTAVGFELARRLGAEIISVDSRQVYRYLDIGTDKISPADRRRVIHHMIDVADPDEIFTAADFISGAADAIRRIRGRGRTPILVGGSPLYYRALEGNMISESLPKDDAVRSELEAEAESAGTAFLHDRLASIDPDRAARIHPNDRVRVVRALELFELTGQNATELYFAAEKMAGVSRIEYFGITADREILRRKIEQRAARQFQSGYPDEVRFLLDNGYSRDLPALRGFGYRELVDYHNGKISLDEALAGDIRSTKAFFRRQMTWFRHFYPIIWYDISKGSAESAVDDMEFRIREGILSSSAGDCRR
jgi:tRNA dimethylallyltransferase